MLTGTIRVQLVESEILIAMDIERVLTEVLNLSCVVSFCKCLSNECCENKDLILCAVDDEIDRCLEILRGLSTSGSKIILLTTLDEPFGCAKPPWPCVQKPFDEQTLVGAVRSVLDLPATHEISFRSNGAETRKLH